MYNRKDDCHAMLKCKYNSKNRYQKKKGKTLVTDKIIRDYCNYKNIINRFPWRK